MSDFDDNLFVAAGCATQEAVLDSSTDEEGAKQELQAPAEPPHPAQSLQDAYLECIRAHAALSEALKTAEAAGRRICYSANISDSRVSVESMSKCAVQQTVRQFGELMMRERAELDADEEFTRAFGKSMYELIEEGRGDNWERERYHRQDFRFRKALREGSDLGDDHEGEQMPPPYLVDLLKLWDSLAATYSDGGLTLARRQAASTILRAWQLERRQFEVKNGKATIVDRVWSEMQTYGHLRGQRTVHYNHREEVHKLFQALEAFLSFCDETYLYPLQQIASKAATPSSCAPARSTRSAPAWKFAPSRKSGSTRSRQRSRRSCASSWRRTVPPSSRGGRHGVNPVPFRRRDAALPDTARERGAEPRSRQ